MTFLHLTETRKAELSGTAAIAAVSAMIGLMFAGSTLLTPLYVIYKQQFSFSQITLTLVYAAYVVGNVTALLLLGRLSDEIGRRSAALPALAVAAVSTLIYLFAENTATLFVARILSGLGIGIAAGTGTAWLAELVGKDDKARATTIATTANFCGIAIGPLVAGLLAQYAPAPLRLPYVVYLIAVVVVALPLWRVPETVSRTVRSLKEISLRPRLGVPRKIRAQFVAPAVTVFGAMALVGFFAALAPSILAQELHQTSHFAAGAIVFEMGIVVAAIIPLTQHVPSRTAMLAALALMIPSVALIVAAQAVASMPLMIAATAVCGASAGLGYRGSLQVVNQIAPAGRRAEVVSSYFVCGFSGNALPVIGVGVISTYADAITASLIFAAMIAIFAVVAFVFGLKYSR
jgi:MFS family permease